MPSNGSYATNEAISCTTVPVERSTTRAGPEISVHTKSKSALAGSVAPSKSAGCDCWPEDSELTTMSRSGAPTNILPFAASAATDAPNLSPAAGSGCGIVSRTAPAELSTYARPASDFAVPLASSYRGAPTTASDVPSAAIEEPKPSEAVLSSVYTKEPELAASWLTRFWDGAPTSTFPLGSASRACPKKPTPPAGTYARAHSAPAAEGGRSTSTVTRVGGEEAPRASTATYVNVVVPENPELAVNVRSVLSDFMDTVPEVFAVSTEDMDRASPSGSESLKSTSIVTGSVPDVCARSDSVDGAPLDGGGGMSETVTEV